ncbi:DEAD/DEAH box helicase family protein [Flavobacteriaceae bacterium F89]|uniref:DEAD/DEAH box helicase family protein n=1 Tax=Cerina litoralis TaxID=2874477 RepID=A0AAE3JTF3_9FLAO|nr:type ISP restriction/modification enzyme [Cerina litoralis]MCG2461462.1 DEAD/DEAH box helicase family protein [Cerina litoralis]
MSFQKILDKYRKISFSERDKGDRFERLMQAYLKTDPKYASKFKNVWMWNEFPGKLDLGGGDTGIDLVALTHEGDYWAIQCKCYQESSTMDKPAVDSFLSTSSREFKNEQMQTTRFTQRLWISTTNRWGSNATEAIRNQNPPVTRINLFDLIEAPVDWDKLEDGVHGEAARTPKKTLRPHQKQAMENTHEHFKENDRGKLIMACGTGKTFTALRIAEHETDGKGLVLFLVPSIALLGQTLREWSADANEPINAIAICSDPDITKQKKKNDDTDTFSVVDLAFPASTDSDFILHQFEQIKKNGRNGMTVVFSTYQSIEVIARAQTVLLKNDFPEFDLIVCDEAHRTTGVSLAGEDESAFTKVHDADFIKAKKRVYMTATPRLYDDNTKSKAAEAEAILCSMDDKDLYGEEMYRIGFGEAVERNLLTDYKVLILTLNDNDVPPAVQRMISDGEHEINTDDASKIIGTINALSKQFLGDDGVTKESDPEPMKRAVAFCANIATSKKISATYNTANEAYLSQLPAEKKEQMVITEAKHMDGTMGAPERDQMLSWLKEETLNNECRIITNVRVLSEGVDVPSLDSVLFLSARNSQVDVVQSVGRVMRRAPGKKYGYIVIPVVVPADVEADKALDDNERYKVVWTVLNALRAHDDRFNATVNKIELNRKKPNNILVGRPEYSFDEDGNPQAWNEDEGGYETPKDISRQLALQFEQLQSVVFARMVKKVGDRRYWEDWAAEVAQIAERQIERITYLIENRTEQRQAFDNFLQGLKKNINPSISEGQAVEMLAQHIITKPIFEALFEGYSFTETNAVSIAMQTMLNALQEKTLAEESDKLQKFYDSVKRNISDLDNADAKQKIIIRIYDNFFKTAFPKMVEQLGIVYTPVEVVDFIIHSVNDVLKQEFGRSISDENIHVLDPFTGTGTFITRLLQSGLIQQKDLARKYHNELHANEIVLLAYYIAAVNIENTFHDQIGKDSEYEAFEGIVLTDTFQLGETDDSQKLFSEMFPQNSERVQRQQKAPVRVIIGNPPYSIGQKSANDNAQNQKYEKLDSRITKTYVKSSSANLKNSLYDSYIKAFRWSTDRLDKDHGGIIGFVSNSSWLDGNAQDGFRKTIEKEFSSIWVFNLRGNQRTSGELSRKEGGKIFGSGSRTPIAITLLVKNPDVKSDKATIHYHDIGDYLSRDEKLSIIKKFTSVSNSNMTWKELQPNIEGDWLNQRNELFDTFIALTPNKKFDVKTNTYFTIQAPGLLSSRDAWVFNFSESSLSSKIEGMIHHYNESISKGIVSKEIKSEPDKISWAAKLKRDLDKKQKHEFDSNQIKTCIYRPFSKSKLYYAPSFIERPGLMDDFFPTPQIDNKLICVSGVGSNNQGIALIVDTLVDYNALDAGAKCFPLYYYEEREKNSPSLFDSAGESKYIRRDGVSDFILERAKKVYGKNVGKEDIFYYVYGILHSPDYRTAFANDLKKMLPRIPLVEDVRDFWKFSKAGRKLAELHINYENVPAYEGVEVSGESSGNFKVQKMRFPKKGQQDSIIYNSKIVVSNIPEKAYEYVVNGKSAIDWIMERYQVKTDKKSGIKNDPNDWAEEVGNPRYILDLLLSIINVSVQTVEIVESLPKLEFGEETESNQEIEEHAMVIATCKIGDVPEGSIGSVVHVYDKGKAYEVEFIVNGSSFVETAMGDQIKLK